MAGKRRLEVVVIGDSKGLSRAFGSAGRDADKFGRSLSGVHTRVSKSFAGMTLSMAKFGAATAGLGAIGVAFTKVGQATVGFDKSMRNVNSIAQLSEKHLGSLEKQVLRLAGKTAQAPQTLADGLYDLVSSGFNAKQSMTILRASAKAATAGLTDTATSTKAVAAVLNSYHLPASKAANVSDVLFQTVNRGVISFEELSNTIGDVLPFASSLGIGLNQVGAATSTMTKEGINGFETMTRLKNVMEAFIKPSDGLAKAIKATGAESGEALVKQKGFQGAIESVIKTTDGSKQSVAKLFPNIRALGGALSLTGKNAKSAHEDLKAFKDSSGATDTALSQQSKSIAFQWNKIKATISALSIQLGSALIPAVSSAMQAVTKFIAQMKAGTGTAGEIGAKITAGFNTAKTAVASAVTGITNLVHGFQQGKAWAVALVAAMAGFAAAAATIRVITAVTRAWAAAQVLLDVALNANPIGLTVVAVAALGAALVIAYKKSETFRTVVNGAFNAVKTAVSTVVGFVKSHWKTLLVVLTGPIGAAALVIGSHLSQIKKAASAAFKGVKAATKWLAGAASDVAGFAAGAVGSIRKFASGVAKWIGNAAHNVRAFPGKVIDAFKALPGQMLDIGKNIIQGLIDGIKSKAGDVANSVKDVAGGAVGDVKDFLGIHSPSKVFEGIGKNVIEGFVGGILSQKEQVAAGLKGSLIDPVSAAIAALEKKKETLQATWDKIDAAGTRKGLVGDLSKARKTPIKVTGGGLAGTGGGSGATGLGGLTIDQALSKLAARMGLRTTSTTTGGHVKGSLHYAGKAIDVAGTPKQMAAFFDYMKKNFGKKLLELFYDPKGAIKNGQAIGAIGGHSDHVHVAVGSVGALTGGGSPSGGGKGNGGTYGKIIAAAAKKFGIPAAILQGLIKVESGGNINAVSSAGAFGLTQFIPSTAKAYGVKRGDASSQIMGAAKYLRALGFSKNAAKALNAYNGAQTIGGKTNPYAGNVLAAAKHAGGAGGFANVTTNAKERAGSIRDAIKSLKDFDKEAKRANKLAKIDAKVAGLQQLKAFKDAIKGVRDQVKDLASQAAAAWRTAQESTINAAHDARIAAIGKSADAVELAGLQAQDAADQDAQTTQDLTDTKTQADQDVADAQAQLQQDGSAAFKATWQKAYDDAVKAQKKADDDIETYQRSKRETVLTENLANATTAADNTQQAALDGLDQQQADYEAGLNKQFDTLTDNLAKRKVTYATWAKQVNAILAGYGLAAPVDSDTEAAIVAGPPKPSGGAHVVPGSGSVGAGAGSLPGVGHRAMGGSVTAGQTYLVGERGPELLHMGGKGSVTPNHKLRGGDVYMTGTVNIGSQKAARVMANRLSYKASFG